MCLQTDFVLMNVISPRFPAAVPGALEVALPVDMESAHQEWQMYGTAIESHCGARVIYLRINRDKPDGRYIEDAGRLVWLKDGSTLFVAMPYGHDERRPERRAALRAVKRYVRPDHTIHIPLHLRGDGGDTYFSFPLQTFYIGVSGRTTAQLCEYLKPKLGFYGVKLVDVAMARSCLHLITGSSLLHSEDAVAVHRPSFTFGIRSLRNSGLRIVYAHDDEPNGANFFAANGKLIGNLDCPRSLEVIERKTRAEILPVRNAQSALRHGSFTCDTIVVRKRFAA